jgi:hypothetical protein
MVHLIEALYYKTEGRWFDSRFCPNYGPVVDSVCNRNEYREYSHASYNDVSFNDGPHIRRWSHNIILKYHCVTIAYSIQYSNMLHRFVA